MKEAILLGLRTFHDAVGQAIVAAEEDKWGHAYSLMAGAVVSYQTSIQGFIKAERTQQNYRRNSVAPMVKAVSATIDPSGALPLG